jgi:Family of unknown function (DUF5996)
VTIDTSARHWPELTLADWADTRETVHRWTQVVGKVRLALEPWVNHWWQIPFYVSARGLTTSLMHAKDRSLEIEFDIIDHVLAMRTTDGEQRVVRLEPRSVADFAAETMTVLAELGVEVDILGRPVEIPDATPFAEDTGHASYDREAIGRFWRALVEIDRVLDVFRGRFIGKASPVHFFWGGFDLATTRFSGRTAPRHPGGVPNCADWVMHDAYSHEVSSCGYWPGGSEEGSFYSYAYPEPDGFSARTVAPDRAYYDENLMEFILPYRAVRTAADPDATMLAFLQSTYEAAATTGAWDRGTLEADGSGHD